MLSRLSKVRLCVFDVDGVLTSGQLAVNHKGKVSRTYNMQDGIGIQNLASRQIEVAWISGGLGKSITARAKQLGVTHCFTGVINKIETVKLLKDKLSLEIEEIAYVADDTNDLVVRSEVGLFIAVNNARDDVKEGADFVLQGSGGSGAVREICDLLLSAR